MLLNYLKAYGSLFVFDCVTKFKHFAFVLNFNNFNSLENEKAKITVKHVKLEYKTLLKLKL